MQNIPIPEQEVVALDHIADDVFGLRIMMVNVFALTAPDGSWVLIDAGLPHSTSYIRSWARKKFGARERPLAIVLTHGHFDHAGAAEELAQGWDVPV